MLAVAVNLAINYNEHEYAQVAGSVGTVCRYLDISISAAV